MLVKENLGFVTIVTMCSVILIASAHNPRYCSNCEEEIWEEVPCKSIPPTSVPTTVKPTSTTPLTTTKYKNTALVKGGTIASAYSSAPSRKPPNSFKQCYCECKTGCKEFCRKAIMHGKLEKDIKQVAHSSSNSNDGRFEGKHSHECKFISTAASNSNNYNNKPSYGQYDVNIVDAGSLPIISKSSPYPLSQHPYKNHEHFLEDVSKFLHQNDKQLGSLAYYPTGSGNELSFDVNGEKDVEPPKIKSNYILTKSSLPTKSNEREFNAAVENYLKDYSNLNAPQANAFQAAYSVSYQ